MDPLAGVGPDQFKKLRSDCKTVDGTRGSARSRFRREVSGRVEISRVGIGEREFFGVISLSA
jgi:hypothetical protein